MLEIYLIKRKDELHFDGFCSHDGFGWNSCLRQLDHCQFRWARFYINDGIISHVTSGVFQVGVIRSLSISVDILKENND